MLGKNRKPSFTYKDGLRDGELGILDGNKFKSKDIVVFLLKEMGYRKMRCINKFLCVKYLPTFLIENPYNVYANIVENFMEFIF